MATLAQVDFLALILTSRCNFACSYCFQNDRRGSSMREECLRGALDIGLRSERRPFEFLFTGGEPLLEFGLIKEAVEYLRQCQASEGDFNFELSTNGQLITPEIADFLDEYHFRVQISFDGVPRSQDLRSKGSFAVLDNLLSRLQAHNSRLFNDRLRVSVTVSAPAVESLSDSAEYLLQEGCREISISPIFTWTADCKQDLREKLNLEFERILEKLLKQYRSDCTIPVISFRANPFPARARTNRFLCRMQELNTLTVDSDGRVYPCALFAQSYQKLPSKFLGDQLRPLDLGSIDAPDFAEKCARLPEIAANLPIFLDRSKKYSSYGRCRDCSCLAECTICPVSTGHIPGNTDPHRVSDFVCAFNQVLIKYHQLFSASRGN